MYNTAESESIMSSWTAITSPDIYEYLKAAYILYQEIEAIVLLLLKQNMKMYIYKKHE